jgi:hypothetical protein
MPEDEPSQGFRIALPRGFGCGASIFLGDWAMCPSSKSVTLFQIFQWMKRRWPLFLNFVFAL